MTLTLQPRRLLEYARTSLSLTYGFENRHKSYMDFLLRFQLGDLFVYDVLCNVPVSFQPLSFGFSLHRLLWEGMASLQDKVVLCLMLNNAV